MEEAKFLDKLDALKKGKEEKENPACSSFAQPTYSKGVNNCPTFTAAPLVYRQVS